MGRGMSRAERLREMERLYVQRAFSDIEMAERLGVDRTTVFKDRAALETEIPFIQDDTGRWKIDRTRYLSEIRVNLHEALALYLAGRRASRQTRIAQPHVASALEKLAVALKQPMTERLVKAASAILAQSAQPERIAILETVTRGWVEQVKVRLVYQGLHAQQPWNFVVSPYLIEPALWSDGAYVVGHSDVHGDIAIFKIERIMQAELTRDSFTVPEDFDETKLLDYAWGIWPGEGEPEEVRLRFAPGDATRRVKESIWHPQQKPLVDTEDGGCVWEALVSEPREMIPWIRGWGADCEVLAPEWLREKLTVEAHKLVQRYQVVVSQSHSPLGRLLQCWGKTEYGSSDPARFHPVLFHMLDVGYVAQMLLCDPASFRWRRILAEALGAEADALADWLPWFIALHDIGKLSAAFQTKNETQKQRLSAEGFSFGSYLWQGKPYHALVSAVFIEEQTDILPLSEQLREVWMDALGGHHGEFNGREARKDTRSQLKKEPEEWNQLRREAADALRPVLLRQLPASWPTPPNVSAATMALTGFLVLCDWLGSDGNHFLLEPEMTLDVYAPMSLRRARRAVEAAGFFRVSRSPAPITFADLFSNISVHRPLQLAIDTIPAETLASPCLAILEAPTGEGKTEAALALAHRLAQTSGTDELYYALPTTATSNQMFGRVQTYLQERLGLATQVKLIHGQAFLVEAELLISSLSNGDGAERRAVLDWLGNDKRKALLMPFGVGTVDQVELAALNTPFVTLRLAGLAGKVVIMDEVHAYDTYMTTIVEQSLKWLAALGTSVIMLSATLPLERRAKLIRAYAGRDLEDVELSGLSYPNVWIVNRLNQYQATPVASQSDRRVELDWLSFNDDEAEAKARWLLAQVAEDGCACWITNAVDRAQKIFAAVDQLAPPEMSRMLLHARFPLEERQAREMLLAEQYGPQGNRPRKGVVVGTQVLEQSLDLDFDVMATDLAPIDFLLQRAGRLHRHTNQRPEAHSVLRLWINVTREEGNLKLGNADKAVYDEYILQKTWQALVKHEAIDLPTDYRPLIEAVYDQTEPGADDPLRGAWEKLQKKQSRSGDEARLRILPDPDAEWSIAARLARMTFDEDENSTAWVVAQTRLGEESLSVIPLERIGNQARLWPTEEIVDLEADAPKELQKRLRRRELRISDPRVVPLLKQEKDNLPRLFKESAWLKECVPLWLANGEARLAGEKGLLILTLDPKLGLVIQKAKEADV